MDEGLMATVHPLATHDAPIVAEMWRVAAAHKGEILGTHARPLFDAMLSATLAPLPSIALLPPTERLAHAE